MLKAVVELFPQRKQTMPDKNESFSPAPTALSRAAFVAQFGGVYEHSPWIAEQLWDKGIDTAHDGVAGLHEGLQGILAKASRDEQLALIRAHPDLAGKAAVRGELTEDSRSEQAGAGLDECSTEEFAHFQELNAAYKEKFGFPYILAVRGRHRSAILENFEARIGNDPDTEFTEALRQINRIALLRLTEIAASSS